MDCPLVVVFVCLGAGGGGGGAAVVVVVGLIYMSTSQVAHR